ncbi:MAG: hypothetical protein AAGA88_04450 [Pseudomonadota bacterium]
MLSEDARGIVIYGAAAPTLSVWALLSFLPVAGAGMAWGSPLLVLGHLGFLAIGFAGLLFGFLFYKWAKIKTYNTDFFLTAADRRRRVSWLTLYAILWMIAYFTFSTQTA